MTSSNESYSAAPDEGGVPTVSEEMQHRIERYAHVLQNHPGTIVHREALKLLNLEIARLEADRAMLKRLRAYPVTTVVDALARELTAEQHRYETPGMHTNGGRRISITLDVSVAARFAELLKQAMSPPSQRQGEPS